MSLKFISLWVKVTVPGIIKAKDFRRALNSPIEFFLHQERVGTAESIILGGTQSRFIINVAPADGFLQIKGYGLRCTLVRQRNLESSRQDAIQAAVTAFFFPEKDCVQNQDPTGERNSDPLKYPGNSHTGTGSPEGSGPRTNDGCTERSRSEEPSAEWPIPGLLFEPMNAQIQLPAYS